MKRYLLSALVLCGLTLPFFAHDQDDQSQSYMSSKSDKPMEHNWRKCLIDKEGWIEGGAEWLYLSSSLTPVFTNEEIQREDSSVGNVSVDVVNRITESVNPEYNSGYTLFFRYRGPSDNDLSVKYHYLRNNGYGSLNRTDHYSRDLQGTAQDSFVVLTQQDRGHLSSHMHIFDLFAGRGLPLTTQTLLRLSGGLSFNDFFMFFQSRDNDVLNTRTSTVISDIINLDFYKEHRCFWGLGPKGQIDFEYLMFPSSWNHRLNFNFWVQFALLYSKNWARGKQIENNVTDSSDPTQDNVDFDHFTWEHRPNFQLIPNINMDFGLNYRWESSGADLIYNWAVGYRIYTYWNLTEVFSPQATLGGVDSNSTTLLFNHDDKLIYAGPYIRFSVAY